jgi:hypothetical protein
MRGRYRVLVAATVCSLAAEGAAFGATKAVFVGTAGPDTIYGTAAGDED